MKKEKKEVKKTTRKTVKKESKEVSRFDYIKYGLALFAGIYTVISLVYNTWIFIEVRAANYALNYGNVSDSSHQTGNLNEAYEAMATAHARTLVYALIVTAVVLLIRMIISEFKKEKDTTEKVKDPSVILKKVIVITVIYVLIFLGAGILQNLYFDSTSINGISDISHYWEMPTNFIFPILAFYIVTIYEKLK